MIKRNDFFNHENNQNIETIFHRQNKYHKTQCAFAQLLVCCNQCAMGPCQLSHSQLPLHLKLIHKQKLTGICGDTLDTIIAKNLLSSIIKGTTSSIIYAKQIAFSLLDTSCRIKNEGKLQQIAKRLDILLDKKEVALKALADIENPIQNSPVSTRFVYNYLPKRVRLDLIEKNIFPNSATSEILQGNHLCSLGVTSNEEDFLIQGFKIGLTNLLTMIIASELQDTLLLPHQLVETKTGMEILEQPQVNIILIGHFPLSGDKIVQLANSEEMITKAHHQGATGINILGLGCIGNEILGRGNIHWLGGADLQELAVGTGLVEMVMADEGCVYPALKQMVNSFHTQFINTQEINDIKAVEIIETAISNFANRKKTISIDSPKKLMSFSAGFSFEGLVDILSKLNSIDPFKPLLHWLVSGEIQGFALLIGCPKLNETHLQIVKELLKKNILILGTGCSIYSCISAGLMNTTAVVEYAGQKLGNILCSLARQSNIEKALPPIWHFGSMIDFAHILNLLFAIATRLDMQLKDLPIVAIVNELGIEKPTAMGFGLLSLGIPVHFGLNQTILSSPLIGNILAKKVIELFEGRIILETDPSQAAKLLIGSIDEKRIGLNI
ncbi:MAG: hypothetical protein AB1422_12625 [bacterium]